MPLKNLNLIKNTDEINIPMKIIFHKAFLESYDHTPAGDQNRLLPSWKLLKSDPLNEFIEPKPAAVECLERAHTKSQIEEIKKHSYYKTASLSAGAAIKCADLAKDGINSFGLIRPPGHHASRDSNWGFCYFNNIAVSLLHLRTTSSIKRAFILDFDLHEGDGNINILSPFHDYEILNPDASTEEEYLMIVENALKNAQDCDIIVASAGFDQGIGDWGNLLSEESYDKIGRMMKEFSLKRCDGRRYALLEGGYNSERLALNIKAFLDGFR
ncbi:histone deacetylase family protein [Candidatus Lokiarchaeum ossiferum]|uniref:histone deacetylase family protein n=1 Tax=Candidatus Lokiarchaeum ossiferum TaxID=2951803 RepID=UPI00352F239D